VRAQLHSDSGITVLKDTDWFAAFCGRGYRAAIFDCDGTLVESADKHMRAFQSAAAIQGETMTPNWYRARTGMDRLGLMSTFARVAHPGFDPIQAAEDSYSAFLSDPAPLPAIREVANFADMILSQGFLVAVGTNSERKVALSSLHAANLGYLCDNIVCVSDGLPPKPAPDIFRHAVLRLGEPWYVILVIL
jgi:beta-phosphoglucomutase-like phosphatase (HAD superfamily)